MATTAVANSPKNRAIAALTNERVLSSLKNVATKHLTAERIVKLVVGEFSRNPELAECEPASIVLCALAFSQLGLEPGGLLGHAYMIPRKNKKNANRLEANFQLGYKGKITLNYRSGMFEYIYADVVYRDDKYEVEYGSSAYIRHIPNDSSENRKDSDIVAAYAIARLKGSTQPVFRSVSRKELLETRNQSQASNSGPWVTHFAQMCRKTAIHRLEPYLPMSTEVAVAHALEEKSESGDLSFADFGDVEIVEDDPTPTNGGTSGLKEKLGVSSDGPSKPNSEAIAKKEELMRDEVTAIASGLADGDLMKGGEIIGRWMAELKFGDGTELDNLSGDDLRKVYDHAQEMKNLDPAASL